MGKMEEYSAKIDQIKSDITKNLQLKADEIKASAEALNVTTSSIANNDALNIKTLREDLNGPLHDTRTFDDGSLLGVIDEKNVHYTVEPTKFPSGYKFHSLDGSTISAGTNSSIANINYNLDTVSNKDRWVTRSIYRFTSEDFLHQRRLFRIPIEKIGGLPYEDAINFNIEELTMVRPNTENVIHYINTGYDDTTPLYYSDNNKNLVIVLDRNKFVAVPSEGTYTSLYTSDSAYYDSTDKALMIPIPDVGYGYSLLGTEWECRVILRREEITYSSYVDITTNQKFIPNSVFSSDHQVYTLNGRVFTSKGEGISEANLSNFRYYIPIINDSWESYMGDIAPSSILNGTDRVFIVDIDSEKKLKYVNSMGDEFITSEPLSANILYVPTQYFSFYDTTKGGHVNIGVCVSVDNKIIIYTLDDSGNIEFTSELIIDASDNPIVDGTIPSYNRFILDNISKTLVFIGNKNIIKMSISYTNESGTTAVIDSTNILSDTVTFHDIYIINSNINSLELICRADTGLYYYNDNVESPAAKILVGSENKSDKIVITPYAILCGNTDNLISIVKYPRYNITTINLFDESKWYQEDVDYNATIIAGYDESNGFYINNITGNISFIPRNKDDMMLSSVSDFTSEKEVPEYVVRMPVAGYWRAVCYGNGMYVAVSPFANDAAYSTNGINWTRTVLPTIEEWYSVCYGEDKFVAMPGNTSSDTAAYSTDGINWTQSTLPVSAYWVAVCYGNGKYVAVTYGGSTISAYSTNGITWTQSTLPASAQWRAVCYGNDKYVAVTTLSTISAYSTNGITWTQSTLPISTSWHSVCYGNGKYVAVSYSTSTIAAYSTNGINWTQSTLPVTSQWLSVCYGNGKYVAVATDGNGAYSTNGINWTQSTLPDVVTYESVCYGNGKYIAVAYNTAGIFAYSIDGISWTNRDTLQSSNDVYTLSAAYGNGIYITLYSYSEGGIVVIAVNYSYDTIVWNTVPLMGLTSNDINVVICYGHNGFLLMIRDYLTFTFMNSYDGKSWNKITPPIESNTISNIAYVNGRYFIMCQDFILFYTTTDIFSTWTAIEGEAQRSRNRLTFGNGIYILSYDRDYVSDDYIVITEDFMSINKYTSPANGYSCVYGNGIFVMTSNIPTYNPYNIYYSEDGINWSTVTLPNDISPIPFIGNISFTDKFILYGGGENLVIYYSTDGISWQYLINTKIKLPFNYLYDSWALNNKVFLSGQSLYIDDNLNLIPYTRARISKGNPTTIVKFNNGYLYSDVSDNSLTYYSSDLISWETGYIGESGNWRLVVGDDGAVVCAYSTMSNTIYITENGTDWYPHYSVDQELPWTRAIANEANMVAISKNPNYIATIQTTNMYWIQGTLPASTLWRAVCYGDDKYVTIAYRTNISAYSTDGITWTQSTLPVSEDWTSICYGNGKYVAIAYGSNISAYSTDGINWTQGTLPVSTNWRSVCYGNGKYVAIVYVSNISAYSTNGISWSQSTLPVSAYWYSVCYGNGKYVAVSYNNSTIAAYSTNGISWTQSTLPVSTNWHSVCYGNGKYVAVTYSTSTIAAYSTNGISWSQSTLPVSDQWRTVCYGNGKYVAMAYGADIAAYSTNGINWTQGTLPVSATWYFVCYGNGKYVAVSSGMDISVSMEDSVDTPNTYTEISTIITDPTFNDWTQSTLPVSAEWVAVCYGNGKYVAISYNSTIAAYSTDGINWTQSTLPVSADWVAVCYGNGKYVTFGYASSISAYSTNGINWTQSTLPVSAYWRSVCYGNGKYVVISGVYPSSIISAYSTNGINWTQSTLPVSNQWYSVCFGNGKYVAIAYRSNISSYSTDGITWTQSTLPVSADWFSVCYGNGKYVAVVNSSTISAYSTDGINWTQSTLPISAAWYSICYGNGKYVTLAPNNTISAYSIDGINWIQSTLPEKISWRSVCYGNGKYVTVAANSTISSYSVIPTINYTANDIIKTDSDYLVVLGNSDILLLSNDNASTWSQIELGESAPWCSICLGKEGYVLIASNGKVAISKDGKSWNLSELPYNPLWSFVIYGNDMYLAAGQSSLYGAVSKDGISWSSIPLSYEASEYGEWWTSGIFTDDRFLLTGYRYGILELTPIKPDKLFPTSDDVSDPLMDIQFHTVSGPTSKVISSVIMNNDLYGICEDKLYRVVENINTNPTTPTWNQVQLVSGIPYSVEGKTNQTIVISNPITSSIIDN